MPEVPATAALVVRERTPPEMVNAPLKLLFPDKTIVPAPALVRLPAPEITPELVKTFAPTSIVPLPVSAKMFVTRTLAKAATVVPLLAKVTMPEPNADPLLIATVPALIVVPPA